MWELWKTKELKVTQITAQIVDPGNDMTDTLAKVASALPLPLHAFPKAEWQASFGWDIVEGPHKVLSRPLIPSHTAAEVQPRSWQTWKRGEVAQSTRWSLATTRISALMSIKVVYVRGV